MYHFKEIQKICHLSHLSLCFIRQITSLNYDAKRLFKVKLVARIFVITLIILSRFRIILNPRLSLWILVTHSYTL